MTAQTAYSPAFTAEGIADVIARMARFSFAHGLPAAIHTVHADGTATDFRLTFPHLAGPLHADRFIALVEAEAARLADRLSDARTEVARNGEPSTVTLTGFNGREDWPVLEIVAGTCEPAADEEEADIW